MKLSVVIVNYNVEYFLDQCLSSVSKAMGNIEGEVFVVDNDSIDGSNDMVKNKYPEVKLIANKKNVGFSIANNQAIKKSTGEYVLLLNPDTVVEHDTFEKVISFMDGHPNAGALGVKMLDGSGNFLPESKRGLPTPATAFYKMFGISSLFPHSKRFARYHLGHLDNDKIHKVEILPGAFMLLRKKVLDKTGLLDESFFMYGEDIDLSYRIIKAGYSNYYYPETRIIHYKGESTKKGSVNYVLVFYNAMVIFAKKHFTQKNAKLFTFLINIAIYFRAFLALLTRLWDKLLLSLLDGIALFSGSILIKELWGRTQIYPEGGSYPIELMYYVIPSYVLIWLMSIYFAGGYDQPVRIKKSLTGLLAGTIIILVLYALLPERFRFSRALILLGTSWGAIILPLTRLLLHTFKINSIQIGDNVNKRFIVIGDTKEANRVSGLLQKSYIKPDFVGLVSSSENLNGDNTFIGSVTQVVDIIRIYNIDEVIFCSKSISHQLIIDKMTEWKVARVDYKIAPEDSLSIIGSNSIHTRGDLYTVDINAVDRIANRRNKRLLDIFLSLIFIALSPVLLFLQRKPISFIKNIFKVLWGSKSWVGYYPLQSQLQQLPRIRKGVLNPIDSIKFKNDEEDTIKQLNLLYARDYNPWKDLNIILFAFRKLGK
jgi:GT2 family glycosyltransferase